jgi:adenylate cyclase
MELEWSRSIPLSSPIPRKARRLRISFGACLTALTTAAVVIGCVAVGALLYAATVQGNESFAHDVMNLTFTNMEQLALKSTVVPIAAMLATAYDAILATQLDPNYLAPSGESLRRTLFSHSLIYNDGVFVGFPNGAMMGYTFGLSFVNATRRNGTWALEVFNATNVGLRVGNATRTLANYHVMQQPWYVSAVAVGRSKTFALTNVRIIMLCNCLGLSFSRVIYVNGTTVGAVAATHLRLETLSMALNQTRYGTSGEAFILDPLGNVVALSNPKRLNFTFSALVHVTSLQDPVFVEASAYALSFSPQHNYSSIPNLEAQMVTLDGRQYLFSATAAGGDLLWTVIIVIPREDFFAVSDVAVRNAFLVGFSMVLVLVVLTILVTVSLLTIPLRRLARGMDSVAETLTAPQMRRHSFIDEVDVMEKAYGNMAAGIHSFSKYVPGPVVRQLLTDATDPTVSVSKRVCTFFFSDIVGFTSISEMVSEDQLSVLLSEYFGAMENVLHQLHGITADFIGDSIFVFWNAPVLLEEHPLLACEAALQQIYALRDLNLGWQMRGLPPLNIRIGINTGMCLAGNFGSSNHMKYTVMGDAVNVASRMEQLNKVFETSIMIGSSTHAAVKSHYLCRVLDLVVLKGKSEPTMVYELMCRLPEATKEQIFLAEKSSEMLDLFLARDFRSALTVAADIFELFPSDVPTELLRERCLEARGKRLPSDWNPARELLVK